MARRRTPTGSVEPALPPVPELPHVRRCREAGEELDKRSRLRRAGLMPETPGGYVRDFELLTTLWSGGRH